MNPWFPTQIGAGLGLGIFVGWFNKTTRHRTAASVAKCANWRNSVM
jgi:hypothetical protein